jgi:hypothetical protein
MKHMKTLGLLVISAMALVAFVGTTSASAATKFTAGALGAKFKTTQIEADKFTVTGSNVECTNIAYGGGTEGEATTEEERKAGATNFKSNMQIVEPTYTGCSAFGFNEANGTSVKVEGCKYTLAINGDVIITPKTTTGSCKITISVENALANCMVSVFPQTVKGALSYATGASGNDIVITVNTSEVKAVVEKSTGFCPLTVAASHNSTYKAKTTVEAVGTTMMID